MCGPRQLCSTTIFELKDISDTNFFFNITAPRCDLKIAVAHIATSIKFRFIVQRCQRGNFTRLFISFHFISFIGSPLAPAHQHSYSSWSPNTKSKLSIHPSPSGKKQNKNIQTNRQHVIQPHNIHTILNTDKHITQDMIQLVQYR